MAQQFFNNADASPLASAIISGATSFTLQSGEGAKFPLSSGNHFYATIGTEVVKVTSRSTDTFTCVATVNGWDANTGVAQYVTAEMMAEMAQAVGDGQVLMGHELMEYVESVASPSISAGALNIDLAYPYHAVTLDAAITSITFSNVPSSGVVKSVTIEFKQDGTGGKTITFPSSVKTSNGEDIVIGTGANAVSVIVMVTRDGGATYLTGLFGASFA